MSVCLRVYVCVCVCVRAPHTSDHVSVCMCVSMNYVCVPVCVHVKGWGLEGDLCSEHCLSSKRLHLQF